MAVIVCKDCGVEVHCRRNDRLRCNACKAKQRGLRRDDLGVPMDGLCIDCKQPVKNSRSLRCHTCANRAGAASRRAERNANWRGGHTCSNGYVYVRLPGSHKSGAGAYRAEHIVVWEREHGVPLPKGWVVHHLNGVKNDNRPENLLGLPRHEHHKHPREALRPYEDRIRHLESELRALRDQ